MRAARVTDWSQPPELVEVPDLPTTSASQIQLRVLAVGIPRVVQVRATGQHPTAQNASLPFDPSVDGVAKDDQTGKIYYVPPMITPLLAEKINVDPSKLIELPSGVDPVWIAGAANPTFSGWLALKNRYTGDIKGKTVLLLGAASASGRATALTARMLGATKIIGVGRSVKSLEGVRGLDDRLTLDDSQGLANLGSVHIVLDWVGGQAVMDILQKIHTPQEEDCQYISIGAVSGAKEMNIPASLLLTKKIRLLGSGVGSWNMKDMQENMASLVQVLGQIGGAEKPFEIEKVTMADIAQAWGTANQDNKRLVVVP